MKILRIDFKNINNLKGEHSILFDQMPLANAGIFAITGPTGAGKSSILDVITLALFNRIPRFRKAISKGEMEGSGSVITYHTKEASAAITYKIKGIKYQSEWKVSKARTGNLKEYEMFIYDANGKPLDVKRKDVPAKNEAIIGLQYDQFVKSILLSQGEFSKFLKADKNERGQLLENITGSSIYRKIGKAAFDKWKEAKEAVSTQKEILGNTQVLSAEVRKEIETEIKASKTEQEALDKTLVQLTNLKQIKVDLQKINEGIVQKEEEAIQLKKEQVNLKSQLGRLELYEKIIPIQADLARYKDAKQNVQIFQKNITQYQTELSTAESNLQQVIAEMSDLTKEKVDAQNFKKVMSSFEKIVNDFDRDLENIKQKGKEERERIANKIKNYPIALDAHPAKAIAMLSGRVNVLLGDLKKAKVDQSANVGEIKIAQKNRQEEYILLKDLLRSHQNLATIEKKLLQDRASLEDFKNKKNTTQPLLEKTKALVESLEQQKVLFQKQKQDALLIAELKDHRTELKDDHPCPLCGALHHPYAAHLPEQTQTKLDKEIEKNSKAIKEQTAEQKQLNKLLTECDASIKITEKNIATKEIEFQKEEKNNQNLIGKYKGSTNIDSAALPNTLEHLKVEIDQTDLAITALEELKINKELSQGYQTVEQVLKDYQDLDKKRKAKFEGKSVSDVCNKLQDRFTDCNTKIATVKTSLKKDNQSFENYNNIFTSIDEKLKPKMSTLGFASMEAMNDAILNEQEVANIQKEKNDLNKRQHGNEAELKKLEKDKAVQLKLDISPELDLEKVMLDITTQNKTKDALVHNMADKKSQLKRDDEDRKKRAKQEKEIEQLNAAFEKWALLKTLIGDAQGNSFANFAQGMTLQNLLVYANKRLRNLSDRYLLDKPTKDGALMIIDQYQGNIQRAVTTLSGGESFLISLALALSLSDMASKNVSIDSLFIDEGFGTLDQETLDMALNTLEKLQSESQKTVGVISHVETLKERIDVQIKLEKNPQGYSSIKVYPSE